MYKRLIVFVLLASLVGSNMSAYFIYAGFEVNQKQLAEKFCLNKNRPWMHCNGKCYLMKKLKQAEEKEKKQERESQRAAFQLAMPSAPVAFHLSPIPFERHYSPAKVENPISCHFSIFQPPKQTC